MNIEYMFPLYFSLHRHLLDTEKDLYVELKKNIIEAFKSGSSEKLDTKETTVKVETICDKFFDTFEYNIQLHSQSDGMKEKKNIESSQVLESDSFEYFYDLEMYNSDEMEKIKSLIERCTENENHHFIFKTELEDHEVVKYVKYFLNELKDLKTSCVKVSIKKMDRLVKFYLYERFYNEVSNNGYKILYYNRIDPITKKVEINIKNSYFTKIVQNHFSSYIEEVNPQNLKDFILDSFYNYKLFYCDIYYINKDYILLSELEKVFPTDFRKNSNISSEVKDNTTSERNMTLRESIFLFYMLRETKFLERIIKKFLLESRKENGNTYKEIFLETLKFKFCGDNIITFNNIKYNLNSEQEDDKDLLVNIVCENIRKLNVYDDKDSYNSFLPLLSQLPIDDIYFQEYLKHVKIAINDDTFWEMRKNFIKNLNRFLSLEFGSIFTRIEEDYVFDFHNRRREKNMKLD